MPTQNDITYDFATLAAEKNYASLPTHAIEVAQNGAGPAVQALAELAQERGDRPESTIVGFGGRMTALIVCEMLLQPVGDAANPLLR